MEVDGWVSEEMGRWMNHEAVGEWVSGLVDESCEDGEYVN
jgi:hypothetical protein